MSTTPPPPPSARAGMPARPQQSSGPSGAPALDPVKILQRFKFVLVGSVFLGVAVGVVAHVLFSMFMPKFTAHITWECKPAEESVEIISVATVDETEMERFMGTQVAMMKSELILSKVISDPRLQDFAPKWSAKYVNKGNLNIVEAFEDFEGMVNANAVPKTFLIRLTVTTGDKNDSAGLVTMIQDAYLQELDRRYNLNVVSRRSAIRDSITATEATMNDLAKRKSRLVSEERIDSIDSDQSAASGQLRLINAELLNVQQSLEALTVIRSNDEAQLQRDTGIDYDSTLRASTEQLPMMQTFRQQLKGLEAVLVGLQADGIQPDHRQYKQIENQITAHKRKIEDSREELLREAFEARVQNTIITIQQLRAQEAEMNTQREALEERLTELTRISEQIADIDRQIEGKINQIGIQETALADLQAASNLTTAQRVSVVEAATIPDRPTFPVLYIMVPAGVFLVSGLTAAIVLLMEFLDQRIKSASDIRAIPRARSLGIIMDASEDPSEPDSVGTAFADAPGSVFAEHFRQLRTGVNTAMTRNGHKSLVVVGGIPKSGASSIVSNLAQASVVSGMKTLVIDANLRRPSLHAVLGAGDGQGLGDVLKGDASFDSCIVQIDQGPAFLRAGSKQNRHPEMLGSQAMKDLLNEVSGQYDQILIDVAPAIVAGDAMTLAGMTDASMLVVRAMSEKRGQVARMARELGDCRSELLGIVVNAVRSSAGGYMRKNIRTSFNYRSTDDVKDTVPSDAA